MSEQSSSRTRIPVAISRCLLGDEVRFNGGHKKHHFCVNTLSEYFDFIPVCPEVEIGMTIPRKPIRLVETSSGGAVKAVETDDPSKDYTAQLQQRADAFSDANQTHICGFIGTTGSPSCAAFGAKRYTEAGMPNGRTGGIWTERVMARNPLLPVEESGRLSDPGLRENFIMRVFTLGRWREMVARGLTRAELIEFHSQHKYLVMAHNQTRYRELGQLLADLTARPLEQIAHDYIHGLMRALSCPAPKGQHCNTLQHLVGYLKRHTDSRERQSLNQSIDDYRQGIVPLIVPVTLLKHHFSHDPDIHDYVLSQTYLSPYPYELGLRNDII